MTIMNITSRRHRHPAKPGPVIGGVRRRRRGPIFYLMTWPYHRRFAPAPAWMIRRQRVAYYLQLVPRLSGRGQIRALVWQMRWALTAAGALVAFLYVFFTVWAVLSLLTMGLIPMPQAPK